MPRLDPKAIYSQQTKQLTITEKRLLQRKKLLSWSRFFSLIISFIAIWQIWPVGIALAFASFILLFGLFLFTVVQDQKNNDEIENVRLLIQINKKELKILSYLFTDFPDGQHLKPEHHAYANDLDIFGKASIYQYINRTTSEQGNRVLADWLLNPAESTVILQRQDAAKELSMQTEWRHQLQAHGITKQITITAENKIENWLKSKNKFLENITWKIVRVLFPIITLTVLALHITD
ncbi:MAG: hypothetical protein JJE22_16600, partial [Bacteroidia bacterium]|nr:hypothetical protein [Bacteroidia bacterium]